MINIKAVMSAPHDTTANWNAFRTFIPKKGEIIVYSDDETVTDEHGETKNLPGIKIGDGLAYLVDLPFIGQAERDAIMQRLDAHINNTSVHITDAERQRWNDKLDDAYLFGDETLVITRNDI